MYRKKEISKITLSHADWETRLKAHERMLLFKTASVHISYNLHGSI
jgi:hypothetical protein